MAGLKAARPNLDPCSKTGWALLRPRQPTSFHRFAFLLSSAAFSIQIGFSPKRQVAGGIRSDGPDWSLLGIPRFGCPFRRAPFVEIAGTEQKRRYRAKKGRAA